MAQKVIQIVGTSNESFAKAAANAVAEAAATAAAPAAVSADAGSLERTRI